MDNSIYESVLRRTQFLDGVYQSKKEQLRKASDEIEQLKTDEDILTKTEKVLKHLIDKLAKKDLSNMDKLVTYGLKSVFPDRDIKFKTLLEERGKKITVNLQTIYNDNVVDPESRSSISVIESFLLRLLCVIKLKRAKLLLMDETFAAVDGGYIENVSGLLSELSKKLHIDMLLVTHNAGFNESVQSSYRLSHRNNKTGIEKVK